MRHNSAYQWRGMKSIVQLVQAVKNLSGSAAISYHVYNTAPLYYFSGCTHWLIQAFPSSVPAGAGAPSKVPSAFNGWMSFFQRSAAFWGVILLPPQSPRISGSLKPKTYLFRPSHELASLSTYLEGPKLPDSLT